MRLVKYFVASSLDNFISRKDGSVDWLFMDQDYGMKEFFASVDVAVMGRKTYDKALELSPNGLSFPGMKTYVFSHLMAKGKQENIEVVSEPPESWVNPFGQRRAKTSGWLAAEKWFANFCKSAW